MMSQIIVENLVFVTILSSSLEVLIFINVSCKGVLFIQKIMI